jgi:hypothetical protein
MLGHCSSLVRNDGYETGRRALTGPFGVKEATCRGKVTDHEVYKLNHHIALYHNFSCFEAG